MCGIAGIYRHRGDGDDAATVERMLTALERRGPDDRGLERLGPVTLGNRRLAILDLTPAGHQPMTSGSGRLVITFNGEIYNHADLRRELGLDPARLRSSSDTEILLAAWERWGEEALPRLAGQWAFAIHDQSARRLWLARDRFGEKPLFFHAGSERFAFASSLAALLADRDTPRALDRAALAEYVTLRYVVSPRTVLEGVRKLPPGHLLEVGPDGAGEPRAWYAPRFRARAGGSTAERVEEFDALLRRACERCLVSDVPTALLLSDGIDSNAVRAALGEAGHAPPSFTFRLTDADAGAPPAAVPAADGGQVLDLRVTRADRLAAMDRALPTLTEPVGDGAALATWMLIHAARDRATVFLCGHGGDEVLGGYRLSQDRFRLRLLRAMRALPLAGTYDRFLHGDEPWAERRAALGRAPAAEAPAAARYLIHRPLPPDDVRALLGGAVPAGERYLGVVDRLYAEVDSGAGDLDRMQEVMLRTFLSENILSFADSVAMDSSAELRMPFLDRDLVAFALALPAGERVSPRPGRANTKLVLRRWARSRLPAGIVTRRKRSFQFGALSGLLAHEGPALRDRVLRVSSVRRALPGVERWLEREPASVRGPWEGTYWALLALAGWCEGAGVS